MKTHATSLMPWLPLAKVGMAIVALCLGGQVLAQAAPNAPANGGSAADQARPATSTDDHAKRPLREVRRGPVKPPHYPSNPQPPVPTRR